MRNPTAEDLAIALEWPRLRHELGRDAADEELGFRTLVEHPEVLPSSLSRRLGLSDLDFRKRR